MTSKIPKELRREVIQRARGLCEYCQTSQEIIMELEVDHVLPESAGGETSADNLCVACSHCNKFKSNARNLIDPITQQTVTIFNPRTQRWQDHFQWSEDGTQVIGLSDVGRATVERLKMNRPLAVRARAKWVSVGWHPPATEG